MLKSKKVAHGDGLNQFKLIVVPLVIAFISILGVSSLSFYISRGHMLQQTQENGLRLSQILAEQVTEKHELLGSTHQVQSDYDKQSNQQLVESLVKDEDIVYAYFLDHENRILADGSKLGIGQSFPYIVQLEPMAQGEAFREGYYEIEADPQVYGVAAPLTFTNEENGMLVIGFSLAQVNTSIFDSLTISSIVGLLMFILFYWVQRRNVIGPLQELGKNIQMIDVEKDSNFRLPALSDDSFFQLTDTINKVLDKAQDYFQSLRKKEIELNQTNEEITAAYEQLTATEEELRMQYDEIQNYLENLENLKQKYEIAIRGTGCAVWEINLNNMEIEFTQEFSTIVEAEYVEKKHVRQAATEYLYEGDRHLFLGEYHRFLNGEIKEIYQQIRIQTKEQKIKWVLVRGTGIYDVRGKLRFINGIVLDVNKMKEQEEYIQHLAFHDPLTELPNRRWFLKTLKQELAKEASGAVMLLDLDNFKEINDSLGHVYGDQVLQKIAEKIIAVADNNLSVSRFGGDEFLILLSGTNSLIVIEDYIERIRNVFLKDFLIQGNEIHINYSMGISLFPNDSQDENQLITNADTAMYHVKNTGRNSYAFFNSTMLEKVLEKKEMEAILRDEIKNNGFLVWYQPQIQIKTGEIASFEALIRLKHYPLSPAQFIPVAEETGLIQEIGRWITKKAVAQLVQWRNKGFDLKPIAVNFSSKQLLDEKYPVFLYELLMKNEIDPQLIEIEITESILLEREEDTINFLNKLKSIGVRLALDDFGTGFSSLSYLTFMPVDKIKLDKSLSDKFLGMDDSRVIESLITLAHSLNLSVTAEGIEEREQLERLKAGGCDYVQGYLFSKPLESHSIDPIYNQKFL